MFADDARGEHAKEVQKGTRKVYERRLNEKRLNMSKERIRNR